MKSIDFDEVIALKSAVNKECGIYVHFHDYCSSQVFSLDEPNEKAQAFIEKYFAEKGFRVVFNDEGTDFMLE
jgi:hypothetical protein